jgi:Uma2 family endonuclease
MWSEQEYLALSGNRLVEFSDGFVEVLPMPTMLHQLIVAFLYRAMLACTAGERNPGTVLFAPFRIRIHTGRYREPDLMYMRERNASRMGNEFWDGADLVIEVVSDDDRRRDLETKRVEYAQSGIPEYWIVDPLKSEITVLKLATDRYHEHGIFTPGQRATSLVLEGFDVDVAEVFSVK